LLARLDPTGLDAATASARAEAIRTEADRKRMDALLAKGWVTRARMESAEAAAVAARARVTQTGFDSRLGRIVAPAAGIVLRRAAEPGQIIAAGTPVLTIGEIGSVYVLRLPVSDSDLAGVRIGERAQVVLPALSPNPVAATVGEIGARGDDRTGTFQVELRLPPVPGLRSGLIGNARLATGRAAAGPLAIPATAVFSARADEGFVYVYRPGSGTVKARLVQLGAVDDRSVTVTAGLQPGEQVARSGVDRLRDGIRVSIAK
jgi:RND family efflux transporter MFP subunit